MRLFTYNFTDNSKTVLSDEETDFDIEVRRKFTNVDYVHTETIVQYNENYTYKFDETQMEKTMETFNGAGISTWHQLMHRPDFLNAFKSFSQLKNLYIKSDPYYRYFTRNIFQLAYNDLNQLGGSVFYGLSLSS